MSSDPLIHELDARYLEPPEPFVRTMEALEALPAGGKLKILLFREPFPLYKVIDQDGYRRSTTMLDDGTFEILVWK